MDQYKITTKIQKALADTITPVAAYLRLRKFFPPAVLLESSDYHAAENSFSYICCDPLARIEMFDGAVQETFPDGRKRIRPFEEVAASKKNLVRTALADFMAKFASDKAASLPPGVINGLFGYLSYDAVEQMEDISFQTKPLPGQEIPLMYYAVYRHVLAIDHFRDELYVLENLIEPGVKARDYNIFSLAAKPDFQADRFRTEGPAESNFTDDQHRELIQSCKRHIYRGDVFQIVPSRKFSQRFSGDDFNVYRALRSINPSPYLFYFDCDNFHIFGSSPESQLIIKGNKASIFPIAGTYKRTGNDTEDSRAAQALLQDQKESAEHVMLVDLARNDLSIHCHPVRVETFKEVQHYSHVIHLVSKVTGVLNPEESAISVLTSTFPAGTLSGAPKYKAMQLIDRYEGVRRSFYGGAIGFIGFNGDINHAITIRSFLSKNNILHSQAGGGVVADSIPENEVQEVSNKLEALKAAVKMAEGM